MFVSNDDLFLWKMKEKLHERKKCVFLSPNPEEKETNGTKYLQHYYDTTWCDMVPRYVL